MIYVVMRMLLACVGEDEGDVWDIFMTSYNKSNFSLV